MKRVTLSLLIATVCGSAYADFSILDPAAQPVSSPPASIQNAPPPQQMPNIGQLPMAAPIAANIQKMPTAPLPNMTSLADTLKKITPKGWHVYSDKSLNTSIPVEYNPNTDFKQALSYLATRYNLVFTVDEAKRLIKLDQGPGGMRDTNLDNQKLAQNNLVPEKPPLSVTPNGLLQLVVKDNQKLSEALEVFLKSGNWDLVWEAGSDIVVTKGYTITDKELSKVLTGALSKFKLYAELHPKNNTAVIRSNTTVD